MTSADFCTDGRGSPAAAGHPAPLQAGDSRADDRRRSVRLSPERVTIERSYLGIAMRLSVPVAHYTGVCVSVRAAEPGGFVCELRLLHRDPDLSVLLLATRDEARVWAEWRDAARFFALPALVERDAGVETCATGASGPLPRRRRRRARPGIVLRRLARPEAMHTVHREHEIIAPE